MKSGQIISAIILLFGLVIGFSCKKDKQNTPDDLNLTPQTPPPLKTIKATVLEYGTDNPIAGADVLTCTSPLSFYQCSGDYTRSVTNNNGQASFSARQYFFGTVEKTGYFQNIFNPCFLKYSGSDSMAGIHTSESFIVRIVPKTDFTLHIKDASGANPGNGMMLVADVNFHGCSGSKDVLSISLRPGIDTTLIIRDFWGNSNYRFRVGRNYESDCSCFTTEYYNQNKFVANGATNFFDIIY